MFKEFPNVTCIKIREGNKRIVSIKEGAEFVKGSRIFIVDDLVKTGGTLIETKNKLLEAGASSVSAYVTHVRIRKF
jgi:phosphoribosylpyrophosphate synthetase